ncbi:hypothetical protein ANN_21163 [Periplaneta americana]|uniref:Uncharacterized protein n=1 Tax=Periplaneta americana TaxID=6978 RepID=A0ABQ8SFQ6_PERAM|nr:hypothetical protein ANN_21163 [Periplaneta americana]
MLNHVNIHSTSTRKVNAIATTVNNEHTSRKGPSNRRYQVSNSSIQRLFSTMNSIWTDEKSRMRIETVKASLQVKTKFHVSCEELSVKLYGNEQIFKKIYSSDKHTDALVAVVAVRWSQASTPRHTTARSPTDSRTWRRAYIQNRLGVRNIGDRAPTRVQCLGG